MAIKVRRCLGHRHPTGAERRLHHRDPFDRLLVAQTISESLLLVSADGAFHAYGGPLQDARH